MVRGLRIRTMDSAGIVSGTSRRPDVIGASRFYKADLTELKCWNAGGGVSIKINGLRLTA